MFQPVEITVIRTRLERYNPLMRSTKIQRNVCYKINLPSRRFYSQLPLKVTPKTTPFGVYKINSHSAAPESSTKWWNYFIQVEMTWKCRLCSLNGMLRGINLSDKHKILRQLYEALERKFQTPKQTRLFPIFVNRLFHH